MGQILCASLLVLVLAEAASESQAQSCQTAADMNDSTRAALETAARRYFDLTAKGDSAGLRQNAITSVAADFSGIETAVKDNQAAFAGAQVTARPPFLLQAEGTAPIARAEFFCGVFGKNGQTANSAIFVLNDLAPGNYGVVIQDVASSKGAYTFSLVLEQQGSDWKLGGFYAKPAQAAGQDAKWFIEHARGFKAKGQMHDAWFYYQEARDLLAPLPFMSTQATDKLYDESQDLQPSDLPASGNAVDLPAGPKTYKLTSLFPLGVGGDLDLVVKYQAADISNNNQTYQENLAVIGALVAKYPELRDAFAGVVARAVDPSGHDYGTLLAMKDIK